MATRLSTVKKETAIEDSFTYNNARPNDSVLARLWLSIVIISMPFFCKATDSGIGLTETILGAFYHSSLAIWFIWQLLVKRKKIIRNGGDILASIFYIVSLCTVFVSWGNDVEPLQWARSWQLLLLMLYYLPIREHFRTEKQIHYLVFLLSCVLVGFGIVNLMEYRKITSSFDYGYEVLYKGVRNDAPLFGAAGIIALLTLITVKSNKLRIFAIGLASVFLLVLIASLARTSWVAFLASLVFLVFFLEASGRRKFLTAFSMFIVAAGFIVMTFYSNLAEIAFVVIQTRLSSSVNINTDKSYLGRVLETREVMKGVARYPLGGNGFQKDHLRYDLLIKAHIRAVYSHNGYSGLLFKAGIPLAITFWMIIIYYIFIGVWTARRNRQDVLIQIIALGSAAGLVSYCITNIAEGVFESRSGLLTTGFMIALIGCARYLAEDRKMLSSAPTNES